MQIKTFLQDSAPNVSPHSSPSLCPALVALSLFPPLSPLAVCVSCLPTHSKTSWHSAPITFLPGLPVLLRPYFSFSAALPFSHVALQIVCGALSSTLALITPGHCNKSLFNHVGPRLSFDFTYWMSNATAVFTEY